MLATCRRERTGWTTRPCALDRATRSRRCVASRPPSSASPATGRSRRGRAARLASCPAATGRGRRRAATCTTTRLCASAPTRRRTPPRVARRPAASLFSASAPHFRQRPARRLCARPTPASAPCFLTAASAPSAQRVSLTTAPLPPAPLSSRAPCRRAQVVVRRLLRSGRAAAVGSKLRVGRQLKLARQRLLPALPPHPDRVRAGADCRDA